MLHIARLVLDLQEMKLTNNETYRIQGAQWSRLFLHTLNLAHLVKKISRILQDHQLHNRLHIGPSVYIEPYTYQARSATESQFYRVSEHDSFIALNPASAWTTSDTCRAQGTDKGDAFHHPSSLSRVPPSAPIASRTLK